MNKAIENSGRGKISEIAKNSSLSVPMIQAIRAGNRVASMESALSILIACGISKEEALAIVSEMLASSLESRVS